MDAIARGIFEKKKDALVKGDEEFVKHVGGGRDIMSVLRAYPLCFMSGALNRFEHN
jgi:hypothetical protein